MKKIIFSLVLILFTFSCLWAQTIKGKITDSNNEALAGVSVKVKGTNVGTVSDIDGYYRLNVNNNSIVLVYSYIGFKDVEKTFNLSAGEVRDENVSMQLADTRLKEVRVIGSRSSAIRSKLTSPVPVDVFTTEDIVNTGSAELGQMLQYTVPSFSSNKQSIADGTDHLDPASIRGLGPDQVLVLVNGKRRHTSALVNVNGSVGRGSVGTDFNSIPAGSIERIEVLRDGAAAQYGSDAIAGVINVVLKNSNSEGKLTVSTGAHIGSYNNAASTDLSNGIDINFSDGESTIVGYNKGFSLGKTGYLNATVEFKSIGKTNRVGRYTGNVYLYQKGGVVYDAGLAFQNGGIPMATSIAEADLAAQDDALRIARGFSIEQVMNIGQSENKSFSGFINGGFELSDVTDFYFTAGTSFRQGQSTGFYRFPAQYSSNGRPGLSLYQINGISSGFLPEINSKIRDASILVGVKSKYLGWDIDLSTVLGSNSFNFFITNSYNATFPIGASPTRADAGTVKFVQSTSNVDFSRDFGAELNLKSFNVAFGFESKIDNFSIQAGEFASYGIDSSAFKTYSIVDASGNTQTVITDEINPLPNTNQEGLPAPGIQVFPGFRPDSEVIVSRFNSAAYLDIETELTEDLLFSAAARFEDYSDFGNNLSFKLAGRYIFGKKVALRAAYSTGFRAPSLHQRFYTQISTQFINNIANQVLTIDNESTIARQIGIPISRPETSKSFSAGLTVQLLSNFALTVDYFNINIADRIVLSGRMNRSSFPNELSAFPNVGRFQVFSNAIDTKTEGVDVVFTFAQPIGKGNFKLSFSRSFNQTGVKKITIPRAIILAGLADTFFSREEEGRIISGQPNEKDLLIVNYQINKFNFNFAANRFGKAIYRGVFGNEAADQEFSPKTIFDLIISYQVSNKLNFSIGAKNLFNTFPDKATSNLSAGRFIYSRRVIQFGSNGRFAFAKLNYNF